MANEGNRDENKEGNSKRIDKFPAEIQATPNQATPIQDIPSTVSIGDYDKAQKQIIDKVSESAEKGKIKQVHTISILRKNPINATPSKANNIQATPSAPSLEENSFSKRANLKRKSASAKKMANEGNRDENKEGNSKIEKLPAEILLKILNFLEISNLLKCSQTSKTFRHFCFGPGFDKSLCEKINLSNMKIHSQFLQKLIRCGCKCLNLNEAKIIGTLKIVGHSQLNQLDLSGCTAEHQSVFGELLKSCHLLQTLTFTQEVEEDVMSQLTAQNGQTLQVMNYWQGNEEKRRWRPDVLESSTIEFIIKNCPKLKELTFWNGHNEDYEKNRSEIDQKCYYCMIFRIHVDQLVTDISPQIMKFDFGYSYFTDEQIQLLVTRCTKIKELRVLAHDNITHEAVTHIIDNLSNSLENLVLTGVHIDYRKMFAVKSMPKLKTLGFYRAPLRSEDMNHVEMRELRKKLDDVSVNGCPPYTSEVEKN